MSTRGFFGYIKNGKIHGVWSPNDSYVKGLGITVLEKLCPMTPAKIKYFFDKKLEFVGSDTKLPDDQLCHAWDLMELNWNARGKKFFAIDDAPTMDNLFCEYSYIYSFKNHTIQCYTHGLEYDPFAIISLKRPLKDAKALLILKEKEYNEDIKNNF